MFQFGQVNFPQPFEKLSSPPMAKFVHKQSAQKASGRWTKEEHQKFVEGIKKFGKNWKQIEEYVETRSGAQVRSHAQKFFNRLGKEFQLKTDDTDLQPEQKKSEEILRKTSEASDDTACSYQDIETQETKLSDIVQKDLSLLLEAPLSQFPRPHNTLHLETPSLSDSRTQIPSEHLAEKVTRNASEGGIPSRSYSLFDLFLAKVRTCNDQMVFLRLSDLVNISSPSQPVLQLHTKNQLENNEKALAFSFRLSQKGIEDDLLMKNKLNQLRNPETPNVGFELLTKRLKMN